MQAEKKLFNRDFILVVIGQIISLFGNAILRFALPYYLLKKLVHQLCLVLLQPALFYLWLFCRW